MRQDKVAIVSGIGPGMGRASPSPARAITGQSLDVNCGSIFA